MRTDRIEILQPAELEAALAYPAFAALVLGAYAASTQIGARAALRDFLAADFGELTIAEYLEQETENHD